MDRWRDNRGVAARLFRLKIGVFLDANSCLMKSLFWGVFVGGHFDLSRDLQVPLSPTISPWISPKISQLRGYQHE